ncbi:MAG: hypothetical protein N2035_02605 [Chthoniobacterales bacterium]|nr:hypothetical protein [Chthoniobacterales bacterium]
MAGLRTKLSISQEEIEKLRAENAALSRKAEQANLLDLDSLQSNLYNQRVKLRQLLNETFPNFQIVTFSIGTIEKPLNTETPYRASFSFTLRNKQNDEFGPFTIWLKADRSGSWVQPSKRDWLPIFAELNLLYIKPQSQSPTKTTNIKQNPQQLENDGPTTISIDWGDSPQKHSIPLTNRIPNPQPIRQTPNQSGQISVESVPTSTPSNTVLPQAQETRQIQW